MKQKMNKQKLAPLGKIHPEFFKRVIFPRLGKHDTSVKLGPRHGVDFAVIEFGRQVMVMSTDPFYLAIEVGVEKAAWFAVHILASDVAVSGIAPRYLTVDLNLPPSMTEDQISRMWGAVHQECLKLGIAIIAGHTARYAGCNFPMVGGATVIGVGKKKNLISPCLHPGDAIIVSKGPAIEATALLATYFPRELEKKCGKVMVGKAQELYYQMSTVKDALIVGSIPGVSAMHDATECGIFGGLYEMAQHSNMGMDIIVEAICMPEEVKAVCNSLKIDPFSSISEGTLLATVCAKNADRVVKELEANGISASIAGVVTKAPGIRVYEKNKKRILHHPTIDPFWQAFEELLQKRNNKP